MTLFASSFQTDCGSAWTARQCGYCVRTSFASPAAESASRKRAGRLVRPFASIAWLKVPKNTGDPIMPRRSAT